MNRDFDPRTDAHQRWTEPQSAPPPHAGHGRHAPSPHERHASPPHTGLQGTASGLVRSALIAAGVALVILVAVVLPAEYNIDPLRIGRLLGLTEMGEIKGQLAADAAAEDAAAAAGSTTEVLARLDAIEARLRDMAVIIGERPVAPVAAPASESRAELDEELIAAIARQPEARTWRDETSAVLTPGEGTEFKLVMVEGAVAEFEWTANGSVLNFDTHGDGGGQSVTYEQGRGVPGQIDRLVAAFTGNHGWFFRNRTDRDVTLTLRVRGDYRELVRTK